MTARALDAIASDLEAAVPIRLVAAGKAAIGMAAAVQDALGSRLVQTVIAPPGLDRDEGEPGDAWWAVAATHPVPGVGSERAGRGALALARASAADGGLLLVCLSGGASALLAAPAPGLTIEDKAAATTTMLLAGRPIEDLNVLRRHLSAIKGGRLAAVAGRSVTWAISDVCVATDDEPRTIASGPTAGDTSTRADARSMLERHGLLEQMPSAVRACLSRAASVGEDVIAPGDPRLSHAAYWTIASRHDAMRAAASAARTLGYATRVLPEAVVGPARDGWRVLVDAARSMPEGARCVIASGETVVDVKGDGRGGRNQELALAALEPLAALGPAALASIGTDGVDGFTDAAGAFVDAEMWRALGVTATAVRDDALTRNDSYPLLERLGALVRLGPTGTNVADLMVLVTEPPLPSTRP